MGGKKKSSFQNTEEERQAKITAGTKKVNDIFAQFNDDFYNKRASDYQAWAMPQVEDQYSKAQKELLFALTRQFGSTNTSEATSRQAELAKDYGLAKTRQTEQGLAVANQARNEMEGNRSNVLSQLSASADPDAAATQALSQSELAQHVDPYNDLGELFANVTEGLASGSYPYGLLSNQPSWLKGAGGGATPKNSSIVTS